MLHNYLTIAFLCTVSKYSNQVDWMRSRYTLKKPNSGSILICMIIIYFD